MHWNQSEAHPWIHEERFSLVLESMDGTDFLPGFPLYQKILVCSVPASWFEKRPVL